jgi:DNA-binding HxlR family transcriptional regulator
MQTNDADADVAAKNEEVCSVVQAVEEIGSQWRLIVLHGLQDGEHRFNELKRATGANSRTLSRVLDDLEDAGLVDRRVEDRPIATYYSLTEAGRRLCPVFDELESWADDWLLDDTDVSSRDGEKAVDAEQATPGDD